MNPNIIHELEYKYDTLFKVHEKQAEIEEHLRICRKCLNPTIGCKEILVKQNELQNLKDKLK
jgi:hypothetical protein